MRHNALNWLSVAAYTGLITWISMSPDLPAAAPHLFEGEDKVAHAFIYSLHALLIGVTLQAYVGLSAARWAALALSSLCGVGMEFAQGAWTAGARTFSAGDMLANAVGAAAGVVALRFMPRKG